jgi:hypothetical protein
LKAGSPLGASYSCPDGSRYGALKKVEQKFIQRLESDENDKNLETGLCFDDERCDVLRRQRKNLFQKLGNDKHLESYPCSDD